MPYDNETVQVGIEELAKRLGVSERKVHRLLPELRSAGVAFEMWVGKPPKKRICFWQSELVRWTRIRGHKGEPI